MEKKLKAEPPCRALAGAPGRARFGGPRAAAAPRCRAASHPRVFGFRWWSSAPGLGGARSQAAICRGFFCCAWVILQVFPEPWGDGALLRIVVCGVSGRRAKRRGLGVETLR